MELGQKIVTHLFQLRTSIPDLGQYSINLVEEVDGKRLVLQSFPEVRTGFSLSDVSTALFSVGAAYGIMASFNYVLTLGFLLGALANNFSI
jgi:hypothetical protein